MTCQGADGCFLVVLTAMRKGGPHPAVALNGRWGKAPDAGVKIGGLTVGIEGDEVELED